MSRQDIEVEDLVKDLRDRIQYYEPIYKRKLTRLNEEALIRRAYTVLTTCEISSREYEQEIRDLEDSLRAAQDEACELSWQLEKARDEADTLRWKLAELEGKVHA